MAILVLISAPVFAQSGVLLASHHTAPTATAVASPLSDGEIRKIDKSAGKVTIRHSELRNLEMPSMTMVFRVKDPAMLDQLKEGDRIRFAADRIDGVYTVVVVEVVK